MGRGKGETGGEGGKGKDDLHPTLFLGPASAASIGDGHKKLSSAGAIRSFLFFILGEMHHYNTCNIPLQDDNNCIFETGQQGSKLH